ncbi:unnamed protein product, partial [Ectocarpus fasciculatus]
GAVAEAAAVGRSSSQDTDVSSTSGAEDASPASKESFSPTEGGGASAKPVPSSSSSGTARSPKDSRSASKDAAQPPPRGSVPELPPPQPREPAKATGGGGGGCGQGRGRKRAKRDGAGDKQKPPARFSQLQCVRVVSGADQGPAAGVSSSQDAAAAEDCSGVHPNSTPAGAGSVAS